MARDWGSRDRPFIALTARVRTALLSVAGGTDSHECVLLQGSGSYALEAAIGTLVPRAGKLLVLVNGAYGRRMARMAEVVGRAHAVSETVEDAPPDPAGLDGLLAADPGISHVRGLPMRDHVRHPQSGGRDRGRGGGARPAPPGRCHERVRRAAARSRTVAVRGRDRVGQQVSRRGAGGGLRVGGAGCTRGGRSQRAVAGARSPRPVARIRSHRPVALHPADPT